MLNEKKILLYENMKSLFSLNAYTVHWMARGYTMFCVSSIEVKTDCLHTIRPICVILQKKKKNLLRKDCVVWKVGQDLERYVYLVSTIIFIFVLMKR